MSERVYLDYNATTPLLPAAREAIIQALDAFGNPSSGHWAGREAKRVLATARAQVAALAERRPEDVIFTSGATEAIHQAVLSAGPGRVVLSAIEHPAVPGAAHVLGERELDVVAPHAHGALRAEDVLARVDAGLRPALVAVMAANNVTGVLQPIGPLGPALRERGVPFLVDATQIAGKLPLPGIDADYIVLAAHKLGGPKGIGALIVRPGAALRPTFLGGGQEHGHRAGTESTLGLAGFGAAAAECWRRLDALTQRYQALRDDLEGRLLAALPGASVIGAGVPRLPNTCALILPHGVAADPVIKRLIAVDIAVSAGSACHAGSVTPSPILLASGFTADEALRTIRLSVGHATSEADIDRVVAELPAAAMAVAGAEGPEEPA